MFVCLLLSEFSFQHLYIKCLQGVYLKIFSHAILRDIHTISFVKYSYYVQKFLLNVHKDLPNFYCYKIYFFWHFLIFERLKYTRFTVNFSMYQIF